MNRAQFLRVLAEFGATLDTTSEEFDLNIDAPRGKVFASNGCHCVCVPWNNSGGQSWKSNAYQDAAHQIRMGLYDCSDAECDVCNP